jgi:hypothetical protein
MDEISSHDRGEQLKGANTKLLYAYSMLSDAAAFCRAAGYEELSDSIRGVQSAADDQRRLVLEARERLFRQPAPPDDTLVLTRVTAADGVGLSCENCGRPAAAKATAGAAACTMCEDCTGRFVGAATPIHKRPGMSDTLGRWFACTAPTITLDVSE